MPDAPRWPGRRGPAAIDALAWPLLWVALVSHAPAAVGIVGPFVLAMAVVYGVGRLYCAPWFNHRYRFTTWRCGRVVVLLLVIGAVLKVTVLV